jgi:hypothetical protein
VPAGGSGAVTWSNVVYRYEHGRYIAIGDVDATLWALFDPEGVPDGGNAWAWSAGAGLSRLSELRDGVTAVSAGQVVQVDAGDLVWSGARVARVAATFVRTSDALVELAFGGSRAEVSVAGTAEHPFYAEGSWRPMGRLGGGDHLRSATAADLTVSVAADRAGVREVVHNLEVEGLHTYFVGSDDLWALVHNSCAALGDASSSTARLEARAAEIHGALDPIAAKQRTTAVLQTSAGDIVGGGARDLNPAQRAMLGSGETAAKLPGAHAEVTALSAVPPGATPEAMGVSRAICPGCQEAIEASGGTLTSPTTAVWPK